MAEQKKDYYEVLGVKKDASDADIKNSYRRLAMKYHPDRNPDNKTAAEEKFKEAKEAYEVLSDKNKRSMYDRFGHAASQAGGFGGAGGAQGFGGFDFSSMGDMGDMGDILGNIFEGVFGGGRGRTRGKAGPRKGADLGYRLTITLEEAFFGTETKITIPSWRACSECGGTGARKGSKIETCKTCGGSGQVYIQQGFFTIQQPCNICHGEGKIIADPCQKCRGQGRVHEQKTLSVKIPAGVDNGDRVRLAGEGEAGLHGAPPGDLYVEVFVKPHQIFVREGNNLSCEVPVSFVTATLGGEVEIPTIDGKVMLKVPEETQSGKVLRLRGKGIKGIHNGIGDLFCTMVVETPVKLSSEQKDLLLKFEESLAKNPKKHSPKTDNWFDGIKKFFGNK